MRNLKKYFAILFIPVIFVACSTGQSAFRKGNYYDATIQSVNNLRSNPDSKKSLEVIQKSYPMALEYYRNRVDQLSSSNEKDKYLNIVETYERLNKLADEISRCPAALEAVKPVVYFNKQLQKAEELAILEQYNNAKNLLESGSYRDARLAIPRLNWVKEKQPDFPEINTKIDLATYLATVKVVVELLPEKHENYDINSKVFYYRVFDFLQKNSENKYLSYYKPREADERNVEAHEVVTIQFLSFEISQMNEFEKEKTYSADSIVVGTYTDSDGKEYDVYGTAEATVNTHERQLASHAMLEINITDYQTGELIVSKKFPGEYIWNNQWATYNGDKRALPNEVLALTKEKQRMPPSPQEMFLLLSDPLYYNVTAYLKTYYKKK